MSREVKRFVKPLKLYFAGYQLKFSLINQSLLSPKKTRKLMDFAREGSSWPRVKNAEQLPTPKSFYPVSQLPKKTSRQYSKIRKCKANLFCSPLFLLFVNLKLEVFVQKTLSNQKIYYRPLLNRPDIFHLIQKNLKILVHLCQRFFPVY